MKILKNLCARCGWRLSYSEVRWADYRIDTDRVSPQKKAILGVNAVSTPKEIIRPSVQHVPSASLPNIGLLINEPESTQVGTHIDSP
jgi:hypothetical protein